MQNSLLMSILYLKTFFGDQHHDNYYFVTESHLFSHASMLFIFLLQDPFFDNQLYKIEFVLFYFYLPYLSSIHEKANCIAILWTGSPHSLGSCLFRGLWATCLPHKGGASR